MYETCRIFAPSIVSHPPTEMIAISPADASSRKNTIARVALDVAFLRFGCSILTPGSAMAQATIQSRCRRCGGLPPLAPGGGPHRPAAAPPARGGGGGGGR